MTQPIATTETERLIASDKVEGTKVYNRQGEKLGTVLNFMVDKRSGKADYAVMEFGGVFGIGSEYYPIPWEMLDYEEEQDGYVVDLDKDKLEGAPRYKDRHTVWDEIYGQEVHAYYGLTYPYL
jgi:sporulation protein YlmC with PRC-barrel domain